jgi:hypothetical protein
MSSTNNIETDAADMCCASCGIAEVDDIELKNCDDCDLVQYCSDKCQEDHRPNHELMCKERAAELRDELLFRQPENSHLGDCPICFLPLPLDEMLSTMQKCCSKIICKGCAAANMMREYNQKLNPSCPFCRHSIFFTDEERHKNDLKRVEANDPAVLLKMGAKHDEEGDYESAFKYWANAAELGEANAHLNLSILYAMGQGVEKDDEKATYHQEESAIAGHPQPRKILALQEIDNGRIDRAAKHFIIAANLGDDMSIKSLKKCYAIGEISKEDFASALRGHQAAVDATKSPQREAAMKYRNI